MTSKYIFGQSAEAPEHIACPRKANAMHRAPQQGSKPTKHTTTPEHKGKARTPKRKVNAWIASRTITLAYIAYKKLVRLTTRSAKSSNSIEIKPLHVGKN